MFPRLGMIKHTHMLSDIPHEPNVSKAVTQRPVSQTHVPTPEIALTVEISSVPPPVPPLPLYQLSGTAAWRGFVAGSEGKTPADACALTEDG